MPIRKECDRVKAAYVLNLSRFNKQDISGINVHTHDPLFKPNRMIELAGKYVHIRHCDGVMISYDRLLDELYQGKEYTKLITYKYDFMVDKENIPPATAWELLNNIVSNCAKKIYDLGYILEKYLDSAPKPLNSSGCKVVWREPLLIIMQTD